MTPPNDDHFLALVEQHKGILYKVANGYCKSRDDRGDLIQEIVIQLWQSFRRFDGRGRFSTWMYRISLNVAISAHRSAARRVRETVPLEDFGLDLGAADHVMDTASDDVRLLQTLVGELGELDRALVTLYLDGYSHDDIAEIVGISATNASTRIGRIKAKLQRDFDAFLASSRDVRFVAPAVVLAGFAFTHVVFGARQLAALQRLDFGASVVLVQRELERLRVGRIRMTKWTILLGPLLWIPLLVVVLRGFFGIDTYAVFDRTWIVVNLLFGVAYVPFMLLVSKRLADRFEGSPLLRRVLRDIAGRNLSAAHGFMSELARLEAADAPP